MGVFDKLLPAPSPDQRVLSDDRTCRRISATCLSTFPSVRMMSLALAL